MKGKSFSQIQTTEGFLHTRKKPKPNQNVLGRWSWWFSSSTGNQEDVFHLILPRFCSHGFYFELQIQANLKSRRNGKWDHVVLTHKAIFWPEFIQKEPSKGFMNLSVLCHNFKLFKAGKMSAAGETTTDFGHREGAFICFYILISGLSHLKMKWTTDSWFSA